MNAVELSELHLYPIKSCGGISATSAALDRFGLVGDRRWMLVDEQSVALTQRESAAMALIHTQIESGGLRISRAGESLVVATPERLSAAELKVTVWGDKVQALDGGEEAAQWLSKQLGLECRIVFMPDDSQRPVDKSFAQAGETVSFADAYPLLLISQASLDDLNGRLENPVPMDRFRPNIVVSGCAPFEEDTWKRIRIGDVEFDLPKPCARCVMPSIDQRTGLRDKAINRVLASYRRRDGQIFFGQNLLYRDLGILNISAPVIVIE